MINDRSRQTSHSYDTQWQLVSIGYKDCRLNEHAEVVPRSLMGINALHRTTKSHGDEWPQIRNWGRSTYITGEEGMDSEQM